MSKFIEPKFSKLHPFFSFLEDSGANRLRGSEPVPGLCHQTAGGVCKYFAGNPPLVLLHFACDRYFKLVVHIFDVRTSRPKLPAATTVKTARTNTIGNTKSEYHAIPVQRLDRGAGEVSSRTTAETGDKQTDLRGCLTAKPERMTQVP